MGIDQRRQRVISRWSPRRVRDDLAGLFSLLIFLVVTAVLFRSWELALLVTASLGFHEMGHALALGWYRLDYRIHFGVVGAYTWSRLPQRAGLSHKRNSYVHLAGPLFSLVLALAALALHRLWQPESRHLLVLANFSAQTGFINLLPLGDLTDGGKVLRRMASSARRRRERLAILALGTAALVGPLLASAWPVWRWGWSALPEAAAGFVLIGFWLAASLLLELRRGAGAAAEEQPAAENLPVEVQPAVQNLPAVQNQAGAVMLPVTGGAAAARTPDRRHAGGRADGRAMSAAQLVFFTLLLWDMLAALLLVILNTPFWLEPHYLIGSLQNLEMLLVWLAGFL
jgi:hypothetical protein